MRLHVVIDDGRPSWLDTLATGLAADALHLEAEVTGTSSAPSVRGDVTAQGLRWQSRGVPAAPVLRAPGPSRSGPSEASSDGPQGSLVASVQLDFGGGPARLRAQAHGELRLARLGPPGLAGSLRVQARAEGPVNALTGAADFAGEGLTAAGETVTALAVHVDLRDQTLAARGRIEAGAASLHVEASYGLDSRRIDAVLESRGLSLALARPLLATPLGGRVDGRVALKGGASAPAVDAQLTVTGVTVDGVGIGDARLVAGGSTELVSAHLGLQGPVGSMTLDATYRPASQELVADGHARGVVLGRLLEIAGVTDCDGLGDIELHVRGPLRSPTEVD